MITTIDPRKGGTSASNAYPDLLCMGRHNAQKDLPEKPSDDADFGKRIHDALSQNGRDGQDLPALTLSEREVFDQCREIEKKALSQFFDSQVVDAVGNRVFREQRYWVKVPSGLNAQSFDHSGQADVVHRRGKRALILDYKTMPGSVAESPSNLQLRDLAVLVCGALGLEEIGTAIVQPSVTRDPPICVYSRDTLLRAQDEMFERVRQSNRPDAPRIPGEVQCKYCKAARDGKCMEYQRWAGGIVLAASPLIDILPESWTPEQEALFLDKEASARKWLDKCYDFILQKSVKSGAPPGYAVKDGNIRETITDPQAVFNRFVEIGGKAEGFMPCVTVGKGKLKDAVGQVTGLKGANLAKQLGDLLKGCVEEKQNAPSLMKEAK